MCSGLKCNQPALKGLSQAGQLDQDLVLRMGMTQQIVLEIKSAQMGQFQLDGLKVPAGGLNCQSDLWLSRVFISKYLYPGG